MERRVSRANRTGATPRRCKSAIDDVLPRQPLGRTTTGAPRRTPGGASGPGGKLKRCNTAGGDRITKTTLSRRKKKGIRVAITVRKHEEEGESAPTAEATTTTTDPSGNLEGMYDMQVHASGKFHRKVLWPDVDSFWSDSTTGETSKNSENIPTNIDQGIMCDLLERYSNAQYPERVGAENLRPKRCYLQDCKLRGISYYKDYDWDPCHVYLKSPPRGSVEILEKSTKSVKLEEIPYTPELSDIHQILIDQGDKRVTSTLTKSPLQGHPLALAMMTSETQIVTELRGLESVVGVLGNDDETTMDEAQADGTRVWRDVKTLRALLQDKPIPLKEGKGSQRTLEVMALESVIKARVYYKAYVEGDVVSDHGVNLLLGERWWAHPLKDIMQGFGVDNSAMIYEDIELKFYSEIGYKMDNEYVTHIWGCANCLCNCVLAVGSLFPIYSLYLGILILIFLQIL